MNEQPRRVLSFTRKQRYGIAVLGVVATAALRLALSPTLTEDFPLLFIFPIVLAAGIGGVGPGLLATTLSLLVDYLFAKPGAGILQHSVMLGLTGTIVSILLDRIRNATRAQLNVQQIINRMPGLIYVFDIQERRSVFLSPGVTEALGYDTQGPNDIDFVRSIMHPDDWPLFLDRLERLSRLPNQQTAEFEYRMRHRSGSWHWFQSRDRVFSRNEDGSVREVVGIAADITERKNADERTRFIADLNLALLPLTEPEKIMETVVRMVAEYLDVDRCGYAEVDKQTDQFTVMGDYVRGEGSSIVGRYQMSDFGDRERQILQGDRPYIVNDIEAESSPGTDLSLYQRGGIRAMVCVPLHKGTNFVARIAVHQNTPRRWSEEEISLLTTVADRCWESVERARALKTLKESDDRYRAFIENSSEAIWRYELEQPIPITLSFDEQIEMLFKYAYLAECNNAMARMYGYDGADKIRGARLRDLLVRSDPQNIALLLKLRETGRLADFESHEVDRYGNTKYFLNNLTAIVENGAVVRGWGTQRDITDQKRAADALRASEERFRLLTELSPDGIVIADTAATIHLANPSMLSMLGLPPELAATVGRNLFDFVAPEYLDHCRDCMKTLLTNSEPTTQVEAVFRREDGRTFPVEVNAVRFEWKGQSFAQIVVHDISGRKQAESEREHWSREVETERDRLRRILEQMPIGVAIATAPSGRIFFHNLEAVRLLRHPLVPSPDPLAYAQFGALHEDKSPYQPEEYPLARSLKSGEVIKAMEMRYRRGDGTETVLSVDSAPIYDSEGRMALAVVTFIDIAERRRAEEDLRESEERFAKAFRASPDSLVISRLADGVILEANDSFLAISGFERDELVGKSTLSLGIYLDPATRQRALDILKKQNFVRDLEFAMKTKSGQVRLMMFSAQPLELRGEHCWLTIGRDISEQKRAEHEREHLLLQEKVAREEAEAANRMKDEVLATISHELRTPLTSILGWAQALTTGGIPEDQTRHALEVIEKNAKSQARLIDDILDTSRIITGRLKLDAHPVEIEPIFQAAVDVVRPSAEAKRISLDVIIDGSGSVVFGDPSRLQQVVWNLLSNAVKFTNAGGRIEARLASSGDQCEISITDNGMGIEPQFLPYVFERFRQADNTSTRRYGGLGLGLAIVRHLVELHGGRVFASSPGKNRGSTFKVTLPVGPPLHPRKEESRPAELVTSQTSAPGTQDSGEKLDGVCVLVVDDDPDALEMLRYVLHSRGATVRIAASAQAALETLDQWRPDVLVCDIAMPDQDGYELIAQVRSRGEERGGNLLAIALTAYARAEDRTRALNAGYQMHVSKPVDPAELINVLANLTKHVHH
jgi:PAS domain S-box-containing protein